MSAPQPDERLAQLGFPLPAAPSPRGAYAPYCAIDGKDCHLVTISGQTSRRDGIAMAGLCASDADIPDAQVAARVAMLSALAALRVACGGNLANVKQVTRLRGFVRSTADFGKHTAVLDAASDLLREAFPDQALPARTAVGVSSLPDRTWIEIEVDALIRPPANPV